MSLAFLAFAVCLWMLVALNATQGDRWPGGQLLKARRRDSRIRPGA